jgi:hypothetical protein
MPEGGGQLTVNLKKETEAEMMAAVRLPVFFRNGKHSPAVVSQRV